MARIALIAADGATTQDIESALESSLRVLLSALPVSAISTELDAGSYDIVIASVARLTDHEIDVLNDIRAQAPDLPLIVISPELGGEDMRRLLKFNVHDWLRSPPAREELLNSIQQGVRNTRSSKSRVHAIVSTVGGAGGTTVSISMADLAATRFARKNANVALFDLDFSSGNCGYALNMISDFNFGSVATAPRRIDSEFIGVIQQKHAHGFYLYSFKRPELNTELNGYELVLRMLDAVSMEHDQTFLDIPYYETEWKDEVFAAVNTCTLVTELNLPALKHTVDVMERLRNLRGDDFPMEILINKRVGRLLGQRIRKSKLKELFGDTPFRFLPLDNGSIGEAIDRGVTPSDVSRRGKFLKALKRYMHQIPLTAEVAS